MLILSYFVLRRTLYPDTPIMKYTQDLK